MFCPQSIMVLSLLLSLRLKCWMWQAASSTPSSFGGSPSPPWTCPSSRTWGSLSPNPRTDLWAGKVLPGWTKMTRSCPSSPPSTSGRSRSSALTRWTSTCCCCEALPHGKSHASQTHSPARCSQLLPLISTALFFSKLCVSCPDTVLAQVLSVILKKVNVHFWWKV